MKHSAVLFLVEQIEQAACVILRPSPPPYFTTPFWIIEAINTPINIQADLLTLTTTHLKQLKEEFFSLMKPPPPKLLMLSINLLSVPGYSNLL